MSSTKLSPATIAAANAAPTPQESDPCVCGHSYAAHYAVPDHYCCIGRCPCGRFVPAPPPPSSGGDPAPPRQYTATLEVRLTIPPLTGDVLLLMDKHRVPAAFVAEYVRLCVLDAGPALPPEKRPL